MKTLSVQQMPNGFEIDAPSLGYWIKAGFGFALGAFAVSLVAFVVYVFLVLPTAQRVMLASYR